MRAFAITGLVGLATMAIVLGVQQQVNSNLREETDRLRREIAGLDPSPPLPSGAHPDRSERRPGKSGSSRGGVRASRMPNDGPPDLAAVRIGIAELIASHDLSQPEPRTMTSILAKLLEVVRDCTGNDLVTLAEDLQQGAGQRGPEGMIAMILTMVAIEDDPMRFLRSDLEGATQTDAELQAAALGAYARQDPAAARRWLLEHREVVGERLLRFGFPAIGMQLLRRDLDAAVEFFGELDPAERRRTLGTLQVAGLRQGAELVEAARDVPDDDLRRALLEAAVSSLMMHEGLEAGRAALERISGSQDDAALVRIAANASLDARPGETMDWLIEAEPGSPEAAVVATVFSNWARADYRAAAAWLTEQSTSVMRDEAIEGFVEAVDQLDPEAATIWAAEISDPAMRERVVRRQLVSWKAVDPEAAARWEASRR